MADVEVLVVEAGTLFVTAVGLIVAGVWQLARQREEINKDLNRVVVNQNDDMTELRKQVVETLTAMREKITQVEFYVRDNYVSKETFNVVTERILAEMRAVGEKFDSRCTALENKIMTYLYEARNPPHEPP